jgi:hypothetical protein
VVARGLRESGSYLIKFPDRSKYSAEQIASLCTAVGHAASFFLSVGTGGQPQNSPLEEFLVTGQLAIGETHEGHETTFTRH